MKPRKSRNKRVRSSTSSDPDSSTLDTTIPSEQKSPVQDKDRQLKKKQNIDSQRTLEEFLDKEHSLTPSSSKPKTMEQKLDAIENQLKKMLTRDDQSLIKDIIKSTVLEMKEQILSSLMKRVEILESEIHMKSVETDTYQSELQKYKTENQKLKEENKLLNDKITREESKRENEVNDLEQYSRRNNIRISGITQDSDKQSSAAVSSLVIKTLNEKGNFNLNEKDIDIAHRLGKWENGKSRPIIVKFVRRQCKVNVMKGAKELRSKHIYINEDLTWLNQQVLSSLRLKDRERVTKCWSFEGRLFAMFKDNTHSTEIKYKDYGFWLNKPWPVHDR